MNETISIVVPIYNLEEYIRDCVDSILVQTYGSLEVILVDDGSTDSSAEICQDYAKKDARVKYIRVELNRGVVHARKEGIMAATGKYIGFVDGDDWIEPTMYEELIRHTGDVDLVSCGYHQYLSETTRKTVLNDFSEGKHDLTEESVCGRLIYDIKKAHRHSLTAALWNKLFLTEKMQEVSREARDGLTYAEDMYLLYRYVLRSKKVSFVHKPLYHYRFRESSVCNKKNIEFLEKVGKAYRVMEEEFAAEPMAAGLQLQLQKWLEAVTCEAINDRMGVDHSIRIPRYLIDTEEFLGKRIVLYGAGQAGKDYYWQLKKRGCDIVLWADKDFERYQKDNWPVASPQEMKRVDCEVVLLGVKDEALAMKIKEDLVNQGINEEWFLWKKPLEVY